MMTPQKAYAAILIIVFLIFSGCQNNDYATGKVYDFHLKTLDHGRFYLNQQRGRVVVFVFWATYCQYCKSQLSNLNQMVKAFPKDRLTVAAVCIDPENKGNLSKMISDYNPAYTVLLDSGAMIFKKLRLLGVPSTVIIDRQGKNVLTITGYTPHIQTQIKANILKLIDSKQ